MKSIIHLLKINAVIGHCIYCVFSNGEYRYIDISKLLKNWKVKKDDILYNLYDEQKLKKAEIKNDTLTWPEITKKKELSNGMSFEIELDLDPVVLYENSEIDRERDSAFQLGRALKKARLSSGLTQEELAQRVGTSKSYISKIENSKSDIGYKTLRKIIDVGLNKRLVITD
ncbi:MAG: hypothetical protein Sapg2KO_52290 [Saprospiraceae bacterium]